MLEPPALSTQALGDFLTETYAIEPISLTFLPLGADFNTAVFEVDASQGHFFLKLRSGLFKPVSIALPQWLSEQGVDWVISPIPAGSGHRWATFETYATVLYPFIEGQDGYIRRLTPANWTTFGRCLAQFHRFEYPAVLVDQIPHEAYPDHGRNSVRRYCAQAQTERFEEPVAAEVAQLLIDQRKTILDMVERAETLAQSLNQNPPPSIVCHADLHAGNLLLGPDGDFYLVDWDELIIAPKERDLMSIGAGLFASGLSSQAEHALFYGAYGETSLNQTALAYYRYERIIQDIYEYCKALLGSEASGDDRVQSLSYLKSNFTAGGTIELAQAADRADV